MTGETEDSLRRCIHFLGEFCREAAVLCGIFIPLDYLIRGDLTWTGALSTLAITVGLLALGILLDLLSRENKWIDADD